MNPLLKSCFACVQFSRRAEVSKMRVVIPRTYVRHTKMVFRPPEATNDRKKEPFHLGGLQMIPYDPPMSDCSGGTRSAHTRWSKFRIWQKCVKNAHFCVKYDLFIKKKKTRFFASKA